MFGISSVIGCVRVLEPPIVLSAVVEQSSILSIKSRLALFLVDLDIDLAVGRGALVSLMGVELVRLCAKYNHGTR